MYYLEILTLHIIFAGAWLLSFISDSLLKKFILANTNKSGERKFIHLYLSFINLGGMIGASGIMLTGILMVIINDGYGFFQMGNNHWLATKQILMIVLLLLIGAFIIPTAKQVRAAIGIDLETGSPISADGYKNLKKLFTLNRVVSIIVLINFLFAITHRLLA
jgi:hypothetical protein